MGFFHTFTDARGFSGILPEFEFLERSEGFSVTFRDSSGRRSSWGFFPAHTQTDTPNTSWRSLAICVYHPPPPPISSPSLSVL